MLELWSWREKGEAENAVSLEIVQEKCIFFMLNKLLNKMLNTE